MLVCYTHVPDETHQYVALSRNRRRYGDETFKAVGTAQEQEEQEEKEVAEVRPFGCVEADSLPLSVVEEIRKAAPDYRSHGRVLQVATELLVRMDPLPAPDPEPGEKTRMTYRIPQRTANIIEELAKANYNNDRSQVFSACVKAIKTKKINR